MAFSKQKRRKIIASIVANEIMPEDSKEALQDLTDNQLVALQDADGLDMLVNEKLTDNEEDEDDSDDVTDNSDDDSTDDQEPTDNKDDNMKLSDYSEDDLKKALAAKQKPTGNAARAGNPAEEAKAIEDYLAATNAPDVIKRIIANAVADDEADRASFIEQITGNEDADFSKEELAGMSTQDLGRIARLCDNGDDGDYQAASNWAAANGRYSFGANRNESSVAPLGTTDWSFDEE